MSESMQMFPNVYHSDKWRMTFSNIPGQAVTQMKYYDNYIKSLTFPDYNLAEFKSDFKGFTIRHPVGPMVNNDLSQIQIEFKLSEDMFNYLNLFHYMQQLRYGQIDVDHDDFFRKYTVKKLNIEMLDNQKRVVSRVHFTQLFLLSLSSFSLTQGSSDEMTFTTNWSYEEIGFDNESVLN